jgi:hypothetical protein
MRDFLLEFQEHFPGISAQNTRKTSLATPEYNCIAWAYGISDIPMWPDLESVKLGIFYWPSEVPCINTIEAFIALFCSIGYLPCDNDLLEPEFEKIAIYASNDGEPQHAARQLQSGKWTSKLGQNIDIEHDTPYCLAGPAYGNVVVFMKRKI